MTRTLLTEHPNSPWEGFLVLLWTEFNSSVVWEVYGNMSCHVQMSSKLK